MTSLTGCKKLGNAANLIQGPRWCHCLPAAQRRQCRRRQSLGPVRAALGDSATSTNFIITSGSDEPEDVLDVPDLRSKLTPRPSPFIVTNNFGGGLCVQ